MSYDWRLRADDFDRRGGHLALVGRSTAVSYRELAERARVVAAALTSAGVRAGQPVGLLFGQRDHGEPVALAAVLTSGAVALPLDASSPGDRLTTILRERSAVALVHDAAAAERIGRAPAAMARLELDGAGRVVAQTGSAPPAGLPTPAVACLLHTSGTTGAPKPIAIRWEGLDAFTGWMAGLTALAPGVRVLRVAELVFDLAWFDHVATWRTGATLCTLERRDFASARTLARRVAELRPHVVYGVPALFMQLVAGLGEGERLPPELRTVCFAGEVFPPQELAQLSRRLGDATLYNLFGPTETNVCTYHEVDRSRLDGRAEIPIGRAPPYARCLLVSEEGARQTIEGPGIGELVVEGPTAVGGRCATGDRVERGADGLFYFRGRLDRLVKIRGYRVQPAAVEAVLLEHPAVREAAVTTREHPRLGRLLRGHVVLARGASAPGARELRAHVAERLPAYMVPAEVELHDALPRTTTGKVDYSVLARLR